MFDAHSRAGRAGLTGESLELGVRALAGATLTLSAPVADLLVAGQAGAGVQRAVTGSAIPVRFTIAHSALALAVAWWDRANTKGRKLIMTY